MKKRLLTIVPYEKIIQIRPQYDAFDEIRMEYAQMLKNQLAKREMSVCF